jgi:hypothetical protein
MKHTPTARQSSSVGPAFRAYRRESISTGKPKWAGQSSDIGAIAQDDQLDDEIVVACEIKGEDERVGQPAPIKISIDIGGNDSASRLP